jgi:uncharacterized C2H2 Zn-finger protein
MQAQTTIDPSLARKESPISACPKCDTIFKPGRLVEHLRDVHDIPQLAAEQITKGSLIWDWKESFMSSASKVCPKCGKVFKPAGLVGHLYHIHGIGKKDLQTLSEQAVVDASGAADRVMHLIDRLKQVRVKRDELKTMDESKEYLLSENEPDKTVKALYKAIAFTESEIIRELKVLGVNIDDDKKKP